MMTEEKFEYVYIPEDISLEIERRFFEYNAALNVVKYLMGQPRVISEVLNRYIETVEARGVELDLWKTNVTESYPPSKPYDHYVFEFDYNRIKYY